MPPSETHQAIETVFRIERARLIAGLTRLVRDVGLAEELAQDALVAALAEWPRTGVPRNPGAWLMAAARRRAIDGFRRDRMRARKHAEIGALAEEADAGVAGIEAALDDEVGDELLSLIFVACHPLLPPQARAALTLRLVGGLTTDEIARAFLATEATIAQRIVRAKKTLREARSRLRGAARGRARPAPRLGARGRLPDLQRGLCRHRRRGPDPPGPLRRGPAARPHPRRGSMPEEPEVFGLLALMELQSSRLAARTGPDGALVPLPEQNRARWDRLLIARGLAALDRAEALGGADGPYALQAALAACHARARAGRGHRLAADRRALRPAACGDAVAGRRAQPRRRPQHGLRPGGRPVAPRRHRAVRHSAATRRCPPPGPTCCSASGRQDEARAEFKRAAGLSRNARERAFLLARAAACGP